MTTDRQSTTVPKVSNTSSFTLAKAPPAARPGVPRWASSLAPASIDPATAAAPAITSRLVGPEDSRIRTSRGITSPGRPATGNLRAAILPPAPLRSMDDRILDRRLEALAQVAGI